MEGNNSVSSFSLNILSFGSLFYFISCDLGPCYPRLQTSPGAGRPQLGTPGSILPGQEGRGGQGSAGLLPSAGLAQSPLSPHKLRLPLLEAGPEMEKLDLSSAGQWLLPCSQGTQRLAEPCSQALGTSSVHCRSPHPSSHLKTRPVGLGGGAGEALERREVVLSRAPSPPHLGPPAAWLLAPRPKAPSLSTSEMLCAWRGLHLEPDLHRPCATHAQTYTHTLSFTSQGFRDTYSFPLSGRAGPLAQRREGLWEGGAGADSHSIKMLGTFFWRGG